MGSSSPGANMQLCEYIDFIRNECPTEEAHKLDLACRGARYQPNKSLMVIGRAPNHGKICDKQNLFSSETNTRVQDALSAQKEFKSFSKFFEGGPYNPRRSQFWNLSTRLVNEVTHSDLPFGDAIETLAWSNLYKIAPAGRNPSARMRELHRNHGWLEKLLVAEIDAFKPRALLFMTGTEQEWFDSRWLEQGGKKGKLKSKDGGKSFEYLYGLLKYTKTPAIVTPHPQGKPFTNWVPQIAKELENLFDSPSLK